MLQTDSQKIISGLLKISSGINEIISILSNGALENEVSSDFDHDKIEKKTTRKKKDPNAPKQATSAYQFFITAMLPVVKKEMPDIGPNEYFKVLGQKWKALDENDRKSYLKKAELSKQEYQEKLKLFKAHGTYDITPSSSPEITSFDPVLSQELNETAKYLADEFKDNADMKDDRKHSKSRKRSADEQEARDEESQEKKKKKKKKRSENTELIHT